MAKTTSDFLVWFVSCESDRASGPGVSDARLPIRDSRKNVATPYSPRPTPKTNTMSSDV